MAVQGVSRLCRQVAVPCRDEDDRVVILVSGGWLRRYSGSFGSFSPLLPSSLPLFSFLRCRAGSGATRAATRGVEKGLGNEVVPLYRRAAIMGWLVAVKGSGAMWRQLAQPTRVLGDPGGGDQIGDANF